MARAGTAWLAARTRRSAGDIDPVLVRAWAAAGKRRFHSQ